MDFDDFLTIYLIFDGKSISQWEHHIPLIKGCDAIRPALNCFISMIISVDTLCGFAPLVTIIIQQSPGYTDPRNSLLECLHISYMMVTAECGCHSIA